MIRRNGARAGITLMLLLCVAGFVALSWPTVAQERAERPRNLLQMLFGRGDDIPYKPRGTIAKTKSKTRKAKTVRVDEPDAVPKSDTSRTVLVVGDFMAAGLSEGLTSAYGQNPGIRIIDRSNGSSGFVRSDYHDWPARIGELIDAEKPAAVVVMLGANDRQQMTVAETREAPLSDAWTKEYQARADALAGVISQRKLPFLWVGLPAFKSAKVSTDLLAFNEIYRHSAETAGGTFVDIWDGFVDESGAFVMNGPDMNGQPVRLRGSDGITLTRPGKRKVAFYVEKPLNKLLGSETVPTVGLASPGSGGPISPADIFVDRTRPMAIDDPELDGGQVLLGGGAIAAKETRTAGEKLVVEGIAPSASPGRADDFGGTAMPASASAESTSDEASAAAGTAPSETTNAIGPKQP